MADPLCIWLIENNQPFGSADAAELGGVRDGIKTKLASWFNKVVRHRNAAVGRPASLEAAVAVTWIDLTYQVDISQYDLVIYFSPSPYATSPPTNPPATVHHRQYRNAALRIDDEEIRKSILDILGDGFVGGHTVRVMRGNQYVPIISEVFVSYDSRPSDAHARIAQNAGTYASAAFHEAGHNKTFRLHEDGGGGIFAESISGPVLPTETNIAFLAKNIWNWGPQYIRGMNLRLVTRPPDSY